MKKALVFMILTITPLFCFTACHTHTHNTISIKPPTCIDEGINFSYCPCGEFEYTYPAPATGRHHSSLTRYDYIYFGEYPQTIKDDDVTITDTQDSRGYYLGSDGCYYAKVIADTYKSNYYTSSTGETVIEGNVYYFKVEPIRWVIISQENCEAFLVCDSIIANHRFDEYSSNYAESEIRAWLNSTFYETAFSEFESSFILTTAVDNSITSTGDTNNPYICENTDDKIFLLSNAEYDLYWYIINGYSQNFADYLLATGFSPVVYRCWWTRSPHPSFGFYGNIIGNNLPECDVNADYIGILPALRIYVCDTCGLSLINTND